MKPSVAFNALNGSRLVEATDIITNIIRLSNVIRHEASIDIGLRDIAMKQYGWQC